jgi:hypothetical protein
VPAALDLERPALHQVDAIAAIREEVRRELDVDVIVVGLLDMAAASRKAESSAATRSRLSGLLQRPPRAISAWWSIRRLVGVH